MFSENFSVLDGVKELWKNILKGKKKLREIKSESLIRIQ
jgi:hypothetical protein